MSFLIWKTTSRGREVVGDIVGGSTRYCSPPSSCGSTAFAEPDSPRPWAQIRCRCALRNCTHPAPVRVSDGGRLPSLRSGTGRPGPLGAGLDARPAHGGAELAGNLPPWQRGESASAALPLVAGLTRRRGLPPGSSPDPSARREQKQKPRVAGPD